MSQRTIIEFNHDYAHRVDDDPLGFISALNELLRQGVNMNPENKRGEELLGRLHWYGVRCSPTHHHTVHADVSLSDQGREYWRKRF